MDFSIFDLDEFSNEMIDCHIYNDHYFHLKKITKAYMDFSINFRTNANECLDCEFVEGLY